MEDFVRGGNIVKAVIRLKYLKIQSPKLYYNIYNTHIILSMHTNLYAFKKIRLKIPSVLGVKLFVDVLSSCLLCVVA